MSTSALGRVKTILVVDLTHVPNDPFATTILGDLRARLIPPTRPRARAAAVVDGALFEGRGSRGGPRRSAGYCGVSPGLRRR